jgi:hypothetical protein
LACIALACGSLLAPARQAHAQQAPLQGIFVNVNGSSDDIKSAIEAGVAKLNFVSRSGTRNRLIKTNPPYQKIEIFRSADQVSVKFDKGKPVATPTDGRSIKWTRDDGEVLDVIASWRDAELVQTFNARDEQRVNTFSLSSDGKLKLQVLLISPQWATPIKYTLMYRRWAMGDK